jgi:hypothetical protein
MYLKQLYNQHKGWFLLVVLFIAGQLFINFKRGVVFSPFYHYGMYSERMERPDSIAVLRIRSNQGELRPFDFSAQSWDKLTLPVYLNQNFQQHDSLCYYQNAKRMLAVMHIGTNENDFQSPPFLFYEWYHDYARTIFGNKHNSVNSFSLEKYPIEQFSSKAKPH